MEYSFPAIVLKSQPPVLPRVPVPDHHRGPTSLDTNLCKDFVMGIGFFFAAFYFIIKVAISTDLIALVMAVYIVVFMVNPGPSSLSVSPLRLDTGTNSGVNSPVSAGT